MSNEIDRLEIAVEAEANRANRALLGMEKRLNKIADAIEKVVSLTDSIDGLGDFNLKGFEKVQFEIDSVMKSVKGMNRQKVSPKIDNGKINSAKKSLDDLYDKYKDVGRDLDVSNMGIPELEAGVKRAESEVARLNARMEKRISIEGTDSLGKSWENLVYDIQRSTNQLEIYNKALDEMRRKSPQFTIERGGTSAAVQKEQKTSFVSPESLGYNPEAMRMVFGEGAEELRDFGDVMKKFGVDASQAGRKINEFEGEFDTQKINTYEAQIKRLKSELADISLKGFKQGDAEYDSTYRKVVELEEELKRYKKTMKDSLRSDSGTGDEQVKQFQKIRTACNSAYKGIKKFESGTISAMKKAGKGIVSFTKNIRTLTRALMSPIAQLGKLKNALLGVQKQSRGGMSFGKMLGSSVILSFVFQGISAIQRAIQQGSDNLVQYSAEYNNSISGIVTSLMYLKNAWAAAFAPIVNVVAPYLQAFIDMVASALNTVGQFFSVLTGKGFAVQAKKVWQDYGASLDSANDSAKEMRKTILGFDQLNILNDPDSGSSGGSGAGDISPLDMFETIETTGAVSDFAKRLREAFLAEDWIGLGKTLADGVNTGLQYLYDVIDWSNVGPRITYFCNAFTTTFNSLITNVDWNLIGRTVGAGVNTIINTLNLLITGINWTNLGASFAWGINGIFYEVQWDNLGQFLGNKFMIIWNTLYGVINNLDYKGIGASFAESINGIFTSINFVTIANTLSTGLNGLAQMISEFSSTVDWKGMAVNLYSGLNTFIHNTDWAQLGESLNSLMTNLIMVMFRVVQETDWYALGKAIGDFLGSIDWAAIIYIVGQGIWTAFSGIISGLFDTSSGKVIIAFLAALNGLKLVFKAVDLTGSAVEWLSGTKGAFSVLAPFISNTVAPAVSSGVGTIAGKFSGIASAAATVASKAGTALLKLGPTLFNPTGLLIAAIIAGVVLIVTHWDKISETAEKVWKFVKQKFQEFDNFLQGIFTKDWSESFGSMGDIFNGFFKNIENIWGSIKRVFGGIVDFVGGVFTGDWSRAWQGVQDIFGGIFDGLVALVKTPFNAVIGVINAAIGKINGISIDIPKNVPFVGGTHIGFDIPKIQYLATGGFVNTGELFVANERGPEMVGRMGNRNVVANNNQITSGIKQAVMEAMMEVFMATGFGGGNNQPQTLYIEVKTENDEVLARAVKRGNEKMDYRYKAVNSY